MIPALAGALTAWIVVLGATVLQDRPGGRLTGVAFEVYAPAAKEIELVGTFSNWTQEGVPLKGPDALGYWGCSLTLPPGQYEYLFLVDGSRLVTAGNGEARRPDGFGSRNNVVFLMEQTPHPFIQVNIPASASGVLIPKRLPVKPGFPVSNGQGGGWRAILHKGIAAGFEKGPLEETLAGLAGAGFSPEEAGTVLAPLFQGVHPAIHTRHVLLKVREGILKGACHETLRSAVQSRHQCFYEARDLLTRTGHEAAMEEAPALLLSTALALESGLDPRFLREVLSAGRDRPFSRIAVVVQAAESLHHAGFAEEQSSLVMKYCLLKDLDSMEIERLARHIRGRVNQGFDSESIFNELRHNPEAAPT